MAKNRSSRNPSAPGGNSGAADDPANAGGELAEGAGGGELSEGAGGDAGDDEDTRASGEINDDNYEETLLRMLPDVERDRSGALLFAEACVAYGVNPDPGKKPIEILHEQNAPRFKFYAGDPYLTPPTPDRVKFVTAGGVKIVHPMDLDFEAVLRRWFQAYHQDPRSKEIVEDPLPPDLTLPREAITGIPSKTEHRYPTGYLRQRALEGARKGTRA
jgi:hypothetical protein